VEHVIYTEDNGDRPFRINNNKQLLHEKRDLVVFLEEGEPRDSVLPTKLGSFSIMMNRLHDACPDNGLSKTVIETVTSNKLIQGGEVAIDARKVRVLPDYIRAKQDELTAKLALQLDNITRFNEEREILGLRKLTGNIRGPDKVSLLHAAIELQKLNFVSRLLQLGANPALKGPMGKGSPLAYAQMLRDRVYEKMLHATHQNSEMEVEATNQSSNNEGHRMVLENYENIVKTLRGTGSASENQRPPENEGRSEPVPPSSDDALYDFSGSVSTVTKPTPETRRHPATHSSNAVGTLAEKQFSIFKKLLEEAPPGEGGTDGSQAKKSYIGGRLRMNHSDLFPDRDALRGFWTRLHSEGIVFEVNSHANKIIRLASVQERRANTPTNHSASQTAGHTTGTRNTLIGSYRSGISHSLTSVQGTGHMMFQSDDLPAVPLDWSLSPGKKRCQWFNRPSGCKFGSSCNHSHVKMAFQGYSDDTVNDLFSRSCHVVLDPPCVTIKTDGSWSTAAYYDAQEKVVYYSERGPSSRVSRQGVYWYPSSQEAEEAIRHAVYVSQQQHGRNFGQPKNQAKRY
jgi:hypothetical protein